MKSKSPIQIGGNVEWVTPADGNVFADLGLPNPKSLLAKADAVISIRAKAKQRNLNHTQAAAILGIDKSKYLEMIRGKFTQYSIGRLSKFADLLNQNAKSAKKKKLKK